MNSLVQAAPAAALFTWGIIESIRTRSNSIRITAVIVAGIAGTAVAYITMTI